MEASRIFSRANRLYLICDGETCAARGMPLADFVAGAAAGEVGALQYRHKHLEVAAYERNLEFMLPLCREAGITLIVNDHASVAEKFSLPLHLGQVDILPRDLKLPYGRSTHSLAELELALSTIPEPAYIALGTMFASSIKPEVLGARDLVTQYRSRTQLPLVLIGGITLDNVKVLPQATGIWYAVISDAFRFGATRDGIRKYVRSYLAMGLSP